MPSVGLLSSVALPSHRVKRVPEPRFSWPVNRRSPVYPASILLRCKPTRPSRSARDGAQAERLWQLSESLMVHDPLDDI